MSTSKLDELRREIDRIDDALLDLLNQRAKVALSIGETKRAEGAMPVFVRPGREAVVMRRLLERSNGPFPRAVVARIWRDIGPNCAVPEISAVGAVDEPLPSTWILTFG